MGTSAAIGAIKTIRPAKQGTSAQKGRVASGGAGQRRKDEGFVLEGAAAKQNKSAEAILEGKSEMNDKSGEIRVSLPSKYMR